MWSGLFRVEGLEVWRVRPRSEFLEVRPWPSSSMPSGWIVLLDAVDYGGPQRSSCGPVSRRARLGWCSFSGRSRTWLRIRGIMGSVPIIDTTLGACEGLDVVAVQ